MPVRAVIGILDSGVGGLSVLREIRSQLPSHPIIYLGDSAWCPYGSKPTAQIRERVAKHTDFLLKQGASLIVIACNSATIAAVEDLRASYPIPFVGMEPAVKPAAQLTKSGVIGILATEASLSGKKFHKLVDAHSQDLRVITTPCPKFVDLVESGTLDGPKVESAIQEYTDPLLAEGADVLVLGCTHYPFLKDEIAKHVGPQVHLLDTGPAVAGRVASVLKSAASTQDCNGPALPVTFHTTGKVGTFQKILPLLLPGCEGEVLEHR